MRGRTHLSPLTTLSEHNLSSGFVFSPTQFTGSQPPKRRLEFSNKADTHQTRSIMPIHNKILFMFFYDNFSSLSNNSYPDFPIKMNSPASQQTRQFYRLVLRKQNRWRQHYSTYRRDFNKNDSRRSFRHKTVIRHLAFWSRTI